MLLGMSGAPVPTSIGEKLELCRQRQQACGESWSPSDPWKVWEPRLVSFPEPGFEGGL